MSVHTIEQDFADRHYQFFGGNKHFGFLVKMAKKYGVSRCEQVISEMKHDYGWDNKPSGDRIKWFTSVLLK